MIYIQRSILQSLLYKSLNSRISGKDIFVKIGSRVYQYKSGSFSFLTLFTLTACGGGIGGGGSIFGSGGTIGSAIKGPIQGAIAFLDVDSDGMLDASSEPYAYTDADGNYSIDSTVSAPLVVITDSSKILPGSGLTISAVDTSSGVSLDGVTLKAPAGASVVTPTTTLVAETGQSATAIAEALGLSGVNLLTYNPYADGVSATDETALAVEKIQTQIVTTVKAMAAAASAQGVAATTASETAFASVAAVISNKSASDPIDFTDADDIDDMVDQAVTDLTASVTSSGVIGNFSTAMTALKGAGGALKTVNDQIQLINDLDASGTADILNAASRLADSVEDASTAGAATAITDLKDNFSAIVSSAGTNSAPTDITVTSAAWDKATQTFSASLSATDADVGDNISYTLSGPDESLFTVSGANVSIANPSKDSYNLIVTATDDASVTAGSSTIDLSESSSEAVFITFNSEEIVEDSGSYTVTGSTKTTGLSGDITYSIAGATEGVVSGTYGSLTYNSSEGTYSYTANNDADAVQGLKADQFGTDFFIVSAQDSENFVTEVLGFAVSGVTEPLGLTAPENDTLTEGASTNTVTGTLSAAGVIAEATAAFGIEGVVPGSTDTSVTKQGTYGVLTVNIADGTFSYLIDSVASSDGNFNADLKALSGADQVNDVFTVTLSDGLGGSATGTLTVPIQGYGINIASVATDDTINLAESTAGFQISGEKPRNHPLTQQWHHVG